VTTERHLDGRAAIVTGASSGIGREIAKDLAVAGASVLAVGREPDLVEDVAHEIAELGAVCRPLALDLAGDVAAARTVEAALEAFGRLDVLIHCAGLCERYAFVKTPVESLDRQWHINFRVPFVLTQSAAPHLARWHGAIVFVSSVAGRVSMRNLTAYAATKAALESLTRTTAIELADMGVRVNAVAPGFVETPMNAELRRDRHALDWALAATPAQRLGKPADIAATVRFLVSDETNFIRGAVIPVDGGYPTVQPRP
jgi:NAD(P)-dependent dehydrogenase (short-subunit alcohol dehydrogenase family)